MKETKRRPMDHADYYGSVEGQTYHEQNDEAMQELVEAQISENISDIRISKTECTISRMRSRSMHSVRKIICCRTVMAMWIYDATDKMEQEYREFRWKNCLQNNSQAEKCHFAV